MRISFHWLKELVNITITPEELAKTLTIAGFEVEDMEDRRSWADGVVVGKVIECDRHPNADKLSVCQVDIGKETLSQIVCGASNVKKDIFVPVATLGSYLPKVDLKLKPTKLRGVDSQGMICSLAELGLAKESEGIKILEGDFQVGEDIRPILGLDDVILDVTATANRADALSMVGIAREVAALTGKSACLPHVEGELTGIETVSSIAKEELKGVETASPLAKEGLRGVNIQDTSACTAYIGIIIENVKIAPSPQWLQWRLESAGVRPINNVVDITNYILLEWGQPLHAFDREKLQNIAQSQDLTIGVRFATENETLTTLDGQKRDLKTQNLLITVNNQPIALAGVMGGEDSEVDNNTQNILLEGALFEPVPIRRSAKSQGIRTEASTRYERGVNQVELEKALNRAIFLIQDLAQGNVTNQVIADNRPEKLTNTIELRLNRIHQVLGKVTLPNPPLKSGQISPSESGKKALGDIPKEDVERILTDLGCQLEVKTQSPLVWLVTVPNYRYRDLEREIDLIEEVARLYGYDHFIDTLPSQSQVGYLSSQVQIQRQISANLRGLGLTELVQYSLVSPEKAQIKIANPLFSEYSALRSNLIDGLINAFEYNQAQGNGYLKGFEMGRVFWLENGEKREGDALGGIIGGNLYSDGIWTVGGKPQPITWYQAKGILESLFNNLKAPITYQADSEDNRLHPGRTASLWLNKTKIGIFGQIHPQLRQEKDLPDSVYVFELKLEPLIAYLSQKYLKTPTFKPYSSYPSVARDLAFFASSNLTVAEITNAMRKAGGKTLVDVTLFDEYKGQNVEENKRSLAFNLVYKSPDGTLKDSDVDPIHNKIRDTLTKQFAVELRS
ncbi:MAG: phenylalanine--tRNA ligase subunit beta [Cyanobacteria bacterium]|nr:phenylalanine--tRNA ligase subunit beta [Cyanobacteria bacterium CG_2015-16_32_12]NCO77278.1 phenylalanine--tRNA ligase subunit beta [Cyanobacteria bacterium CG_2015-22_32_23]NCQ05440.1 phenylalanine--tRNA ligase subunit beta [Cyanobacteria bacterium CG_2015-09_32_10]NCS84604.1 phenylalanine--tRNA ligase subunit beta [Cyanobacteria bacterium CG_2015-02_32_10]